MAGRVLSAANLAKIKAAMESLGAVMASMVGGDDGGGEKDTEAEEKEAAAADVAGAGEPVMQESGDLTGELVPLNEAAIRRDGTALIRIISEGWGSSGYYGRDVLERDGPSIFRAGQTKMYWDHASPSEEIERPEGSLNNLAGELISDARWQDSGPSGPGLYADAKVFGHYKEAVNELAPHIGVSIRAAGRTKQGEAEGRKGPIVEELVTARSVDFVTVPGRGGRIVEIFEAARAQAAPVTHTNQEEQQMDNKELETKLAEAQTREAARDLEIARLRETLILRDARDLVSGALAGATVPDVTYSRLHAQLSANPPVKEGALDREALAVKVAEAVKAEQAYLAEAAGYGSGRITGMGGAAGMGGGEVVKVEDTQARLAEAFGRLGLSVEESKTAANGRGW